MWPGSVEVGHIGIEHALELLLLQDEQMIEALTSHTSQEAFTDGIGSRGVIGRFENLDATGLGNSCKAHAKLAIIVPNEILRPHAISSGLPKLLGGPSVGGRARHAEVDHSTRVEFDNEEGEQRAEEEVSHGEKVTGPDLLSMGVQERLPDLSMWSCGAHSSHVLLNRPLADAEAQLKQFAPDALCSPQAIIPRHLLDQVHGLLGDPGRERSCPRLISPKELETQAMPPQERLWLNDEQCLFLSV